jgi:hypothetical protein
MLSILFYRYILHYLHQSLFCLDGFRHLSKYSPRPSCYIKLFAKERPFKVSIFLNSKLSKLHAQMFRLKENFNKTNKIQLQRKNLHIGDFDEQKYRTKKN